jgi:hypothetical protein
MMSLWSFITKMGASEGRGEKKGKSRMVKKIKLMRSQIVKK